MGVDEIQFDYIRFPAMGNVQDAAYSFDEEKTPKHQVITSFLSKARGELAPYGVLLSIDVFGVTAWNRPEDIQITGQKIEDLARSCDVISPMIYPSHFYGPFQSIAKPGDQPFLLVSETCRRISSLLGDTPVTLRPWIQAFPYGTTRFDDNYVLEELRALHLSRARGWLLWSAGNAYDRAWKAWGQWNSRSLAHHIIAPQWTDFTIPVEMPHRAVTADAHKKPPPVSALNPHGSEKKTNDGEGVLNSSVPGHE